MQARILDTRSDYLEIAYRVHVTRAVRRLLANRGGTARLFGQARIRLGAWDLSIKRQRSGVYLLVNRIMRVTVDLQAPGELASRAEAKRKETEDILERALAEVSPSEADAMREYARTRAEERRQRNAEAAKGARLEGMIQTAHGHVESVQPSEHLPGWTVVITCAAEFLAQWGTPTGPANIARKLAEQFGAVVAERVRRVDLACTLSGYEMQEEDRRSMAGTRAKLDEYVSTSSVRWNFRSVGNPVGSPTEEPSAGVTRHFKRDRLTGFSIAPGNPIHCRIYDKAEELRVKGGDDKKAIEESLWEKNVWWPRWSEGEQGPKEPVTRVEVQFRGEALDRWPDARVPRLLRFEVDRMWAYFSQRWLRIVAPETEWQRKCRRRARVDEARWGVVQRANFGNGDARPIRLCKRRSQGPGERTMVGMMMSRVQAEECGNDDRIGLDHDRCMRIVERELADLAARESQQHLFREDARAAREVAETRAVRDAMGQIAVLAAESCAESILRTKGAGGALEFLENRTKAVMGRYSGPSVWGVS